MCGNYDFAVPNITYKMSSSSGLNVEASLMNEIDPARLVVEVLAREHMKELRARYCWHVCRGDYRRIVELYTPDGIFEFEQNGKRHALKGTEALLEGLKTRIVRGQIFPNVHNHTIVMRGPTEAIGSCTMEAHTTIAERPPFAGYYHDFFRLHKGTWLFAKRRYFYYWPDFQRSGLDMEGSPETALSAQHD